jgi:hypothetical protein
MMKKKQSCSHSEEDIEHKRRGSHEVIVKKRMNEEE